MGYFKYGVYEEMSLLTSLLVGIIIVVFIIVLNVILNKKSNKKNKELAEGCKHFNGKECDKFNELAKQKLIDKGMTMLPCKLCKFKE